VRDQIGVFSPLALSCELNLELLWEEFEPQ
jgi:hypothetical protein